MNASWTDVAGLVVLLSAGLLLLAAASMWVAGKLSARRFALAVLLCGSAAAVGMCAASAWLAVVLLAVAVGGAYGVRNFDGAGQRGKHSRKRASR